MSVIITLVCMIAGTVMWANVKPREALPYWVILGMCGQNGWVFQAENLRMGVNFLPKTCGWVIILTYLLVFGSPEDLPKYTKDSSNIRRYLAEKYLIIYNYLTL